MSARRENKTARCSLETAIADLLAKALSYDGVSSAWKTRDLLASAREYGRALNRIETVRSR
jgi:hypothetical protein